LADRAECPPGIGLLAKEQQRRDADCGKAKHDQIDHLVLLQILTGPKGPPITKCTNINHAMTQV
jgi:hypothetical protein